MNETEAEIPRFAKAAFSLAAGAFVLAALVYVLWLPPVANLRLENPRTTAYIDLYVKRSLARHKKPLVMTRWVSLGDISPHLRHAVVIAEDDMFYRHHGIDWDAMREALTYDWRKGKFARGGSTITQQVARNLFLSPARNPLRKAKEMLIAWKLERELTKDRILEIYLNIAEWGIGVYGVQAASEIYFGKDAKDVTPEEAVALAAALPSPWRLNPSKPEKPWMARRKDVLLERMRRAHYLPLEVPLNEIELPEDLPENADLSTEPNGPSSATTEPGTSFMETTKPGAPGVTFRETTTRISSSSIPTPSVPAEVEPSSIPEPASPEAVPEPGSPDRSPELPVHP